MNSFNHYAYGAIGYWLYNTVAGINTDPAQPGYKHIILAPQPGGSLKYARATLETAYGTITSEWKYDGSTFVYAVVIPPNTMASVTLPFTGTTSLNCESVQGQDFELEAGHYEFFIRA
jgi:alpha-L-rhamnosidase